MAGGSLPTIGDALAVSTALEAAAHIGHIDSDIKAADTPRFGIIAMGREEIEGKRNDE